MRFFIAIVAAIAFCGAGNAHAGAIEDGLFAGFETLCLPQPVSASPIEELIKPIGGHELPELQARAFLAGRDGHAWLFNDGRANYVVMFTTDDVCGLYNPDADAGIVLGLIDHYLDTREISSKPLGTDIEKMLAATYADRRSNLTLHALVVLDYPTLASLKGARLTLLPQSLFQEHHLREPEWPR